MIQQIQTSINWNQAQEIATENHTNKEQRYQDFLSESHEMTDARDLQFWINETGKDLFYLIQQANDIAPNIKEPLLNGADLDDIWDVVPEFPSDDEEGEEWESGTFSQIWADLMNK